MMHIDLEHPALDMAMEMLCLLPKTPVMVPVVRIAEDLGLTRHQQVYRLADRLKKRGVKVEMMNIAGKPTAMGISRNSWEVSQAMGESYLDCTGW